MGLKIDALLADSYINFMRRLGTPLGGLQAIHALRSGTFPVIEDNLPTIEDFRMSQFTILSLLDKEENQYVEDLFRDLKEYMTSPGFEYPYPNCPLFVKFIDDLDIRFNSSYDVQADPELEKFLIMYSSTTKYIINGAIFGRNRFYRFNQSSFKDLVKDNLAPSAHVVGGTEISRITDNIKNKGESEFLNYTPGASCLFKAINTIANWCDGILYESHETGYPCSLSETLRLTLLTTAVPNSLSYMGLISLVY